MPAVVPAGPQDGAAARLREVAPGVFVAQSRAYATNAVVIADPDRRDHAPGEVLVVDPGVSPSELAALASELAVRGWRAGAGFASHGHWDHVLWTPALGDVPRWARSGAVDWARAHRSVVLAELAEDDDAGWGDERAGDVDLVARLTPLTPDDLLPWSPATAVVVGHEAHASGHAALLLTGSGVLIAGDMLSDLEIPLLDRSAVDPLGDYRTGLDRLGRLIEMGLVQLLIPGHGSVADAAEALRRLERDRAYLDDLAGRGDSDDPRLAAGWLRVEHAAQVRRLAR